MRSLIFLKSVVAPVGRRSMEKRGNIIEKALACHVGQVGATAMRNRESRFSYSEEYEIKTCFSVWGYFEMEASNKVSVYRI